MSMQMLVFMYVHVYKCKNTYVYLNLSPYHMCVCLALLRLYRSYRRLPLSPVHLYGSDSSYYCFGSSSACNANAAFERSSTGSVCVCVCSRFLTATHIITKTTTVNDPGPTNKQT